MENTHLVTIVATAFVSILSAIGLPQLYKHLTDRKQIESDSACKEKIQELQMRLSQITMGVDMMLTMLESEFDQDSSHHNIILKVKELLKPQANEELSN